jgi:hypothetical protein
VIGYHFRRGSAWTFSGDLLLGGAGLALEPPPNGEEVSEMKAMHDDNCGARLQRGDILLRRKE